jgi:predicted metal-dependent hydrolase
LLYDDIKDIESLPSESILGVACGAPLNFADFHIHYKNEASPEIIKSLYRNWIETQAREIFTKKVIRFAKIIHVKPKEVSIKNLKNRWGSATKKGTINLNVNLIKAPERIIDYVVIHELCHFLIKEHSFRFWNMLKRYSPDYPKDIQWLNINGKNLLS